MFLVFSLFVARKITKLSQKKLVDNHISSLFSLVSQLRFTNFARASRYMTLIRRISMKFNHSLPSEIKRSYCKHCKVLFVPGKNCRVRVHKSRVIYSCFECKNFTRIPFHKKK